MGLEDDFKKLQTAYNDAVKNYLLLTQNKTKARATDLRKALKEIADIAKEMRKSTMEYKGAI